MEEDKFKAKNGLPKCIVNSFMQWSENVTVIDLSHRNINYIEDNVDFPPGLRDLNLSHNILKDVPNVIMKLEKIINLNLSYNKIVYFDETPKFCHSIEKLDISNNELEGPPYWIWCDAPTNMYYLNISENQSITKSLHYSYLNQLLTYITPLTEINIVNCKIKRNFLEIVITFQKARIINIGNLDYDYLHTNCITELPCLGLDKLCDIQRLNVSNAQIYSLNTNIYIYQNLIELNLAHNYITYIPKEFCQLYNLEICVLSNNKLLYLPDDMNQLIKLTELYLNSNELCMIPDSCYKLKSLRVLDVYDNCITEVADYIMNIPELDLAQNYFNEPEDADYIRKKMNIRLNKAPRIDGRKPDIVESENEYSPDICDDDEISSHTENNNDIQAECLSTSEDWDSDDCWIPQLHKKSPSPQPTYYLFLKKKMEEGIFCPVDCYPNHLARKNHDCSENPSQCYESDGQFDDYSSDDS